MNWNGLGGRVTTEANLQGGHLETPMSIYFNRRKQHDEADSAMGPTLMFILGLTQTGICHSDSIYEPLVEKG